MVNCYSNGHSQIRVLKRETSATQQAQFQNQSLNSRTIKERNGGTLNIRYSNPSENAKGMRLPKSIKELSNVIKDAKGDVESIIKDIGNTINGRK